MKYNKLTEKLIKIKPYLNEKQLYHYKFIENLDIEYTYHSNALEGNTLSLQETSLVLDGISIGKKHMRELHEATNHSKAFNYVFNNRNSVKKIVDIEDILKIHSMILNNIDDYNKGSYRKIRVGIIGTNLVFPFPEEIPQLMSTFNNELKEKQEIGLIHPVQLASETHYKLVDIHPFVDGNGRTARLLMNMVLLKNNYPPLIIKVDDKEEYIQSLNNTRNYKDNNFEEFIYNKMEHTLDSFIELSKDFEIKKPILKTKTQGFEK